MNKKPSNEQLIELCRVKMGNITDIADSCNVSRQTIYAWLDKDKDLKIAFEQQIESNIDFVESKLFQRIEGYEDKDLYISQYQGDIVSEDIIKHYPPDVTAIIFFLKTRAKERGYVERTELTGKDGEQLPPVIVRIHGEDIEL